MSSAGNSSGDGGCASLDDLPVMLWASDAAGATGHWNKKAREWFGVGEEAGDLAWTAWVHDEERGSAQTQWLQALATGQPITATFRVLCASGEHRWGEFSAAPSFNSTQTISGWTCAFTDVQALHEAEESARLLDGLFEHLPMAIVVGDAPDGRIRRISRYRARLAGRDGAGMIGVPASEHATQFRITHPDGRKPAPNELPLARAIEKGEVVPAEEWRYTRPDGAPLSILASAAPIRDSRGEITAGWVGWFDITRPKSVRVELKNTSLRLQTLIDNSPLAVIEWNPGHRITRWMGSADRIFGWQAAEVTGKRLEEFQFIHPDDRETVDDSLAALARGETSVVRNRNFAKDGSVIYCEWYNSAAHNAAGHLVWGLSLALDITARHATEEALRRSEEKHRTIIEAAPLGVFQSTLDGRFLSANSWLASMFHFDSPEQLTTTIQDVGQELFADPKRRRDIIRRAWKTNGFVQDEVQYRRRDGAHFLARLHIRVARRHTGDPVLEGFVEDITKRRRAEEELRETYNQLEHRVEERTRELSAANDRLTELDRLKSQFLASMSHELRTPLNSIIGFTSLLRRGLTGPVNEEQTLQLGIVQSSAAHLLGLINDLLDVSRVEAGRADLACEEFDFTGVVTEVARSLQPSADRKGLRLILDVPETPIAMRGDRKRSVQVLLNLAGNAVKFTERGSVSITARAEWNTLHVTVADTGIGIRAEHLGMLFEAFRQLDGSAKRVYEGTGLGLYLCRKLLTLMGGEIRAESEFGAGSRFLYRMPRELAKDASDVRGKIDGTQGSTG